MPQDFCSRYLIMAEAFKRSGLVKRTPTKGASYLNTTFLESIPPADDAVERVSGSSAEQCSAANGNKADKKISGKGEGKTEDEGNCKGRQVRRCLTYIPELVQNEPYFSNVDITKPNDFELKLRALMNTYMNVETFIEVTERDTLRNIFHEYTGIIRNLELKVTDLQTRMAMYEEERGEAKAKIRSMREKLGEYECQRQIQDERINRLEREVEHEKGEKNMLERRVSNLNRSYAEVAQTEGGCGRTNLQNNVTVAFVHGKEITDVQAMKELLREKVDQVQLGISDATLTMMRNGGLLVKSKSAEGIKSLVSLINTDENLSRAIKASLPRVHNTRIRLRGVEKRVTPDILLATINLKNETRICQDDFKIIKEFKQGQYINYIVEVTGEVAELLKGKAVLYMGWSSCTVEEVINIKTCYKCLSFNHVTKNCKETQFRCFRCGETGHTVKECRSGTECCRACTVANITRKEPYDTSHSFNTNRCSLYLLERDRLRNRGSKGGRLRQWIGP